jgi:hypothetical protein
LKYFHLEYKKNNKILRVPPFFLYLSAQDDNRSDAVSKIVSGFQGKRNIPYKSTNKYPLCPLLGTGVPNNVDYYDIDVVDIKNFAH